jgi:hypothetical protein
MSSCALAACSAAVLPWIWPRGSTPSWCLTLRPASLTLPAGAAAPTAAAFAAFAAAAAATGCTNLLCGSGAAVRAAGGAA